MLLTALVATAGLMGAAGVVLSAIAAHGPASAGLAPAAQMLLFHATAILAGAALVGRERLAPRLATAALAGWVAGSCLFAGDIAMRTFTGARLFPLAAPTGGSIMIVAWLAFAVAAMISRRR